MFESHTKSNIAAAANHQAEISNGDYKFVRELIYNETRINLGDHKRELVTARLGKRVRLLGMNSLHDYCRMLRNDPKTGELYHLIDAISTNHTFFFREVNHFNYLNETILPQFVDGKLGNSQSLKTWSCACSTGEEPYSVAITLAEYLERNKPEAHWDIQCSDISTRVLDFASKAVYDENRLKQIQPEWRRKYFQKGEQQMAGYYRIHPTLRKRLNFHRLNLFANSFPWKEKFQVIFCRNVMIYFDRETQEDLVGRLAQNLVPGGYLLIGHAESLAGVNHPYQTIKPAIYRLPEK
ncbi:MAG: chemotaxis protein methyltransferase CheR [Candidatus Pelagisphaera sp.]